MTDSNTTESLMEQLAETLNMQARWVKPASAWLKRLAKGQNPAYAGSFALCHAYDSTLPSLQGGTGDHVVVLSTRGPNVSDPGKYATFGGFVNLGSPDQRGEQPAEGAVRELTEEALDDQGTPIIETPDPARLKIIHTGVDYRNTGRPVAFFGHSLELNRQELSAFRTHAQRVVNEPDYAARSLAATHNETASVLVMRMGDAVGLKREDFAHPHEWDGLQKLAAQLKAQHKNTTIGRG